MGRLSPQGVILTIWAFAADRGKYCNLSLILSVISLSFSFVVISNIIIQEISVIVILASPTTPSIANPQPAAGLRAVAPTIKAIPAIPKGIPDQLMQLMHLIFR